jgi:peptidoglycan/LPS O-acetylase OafA/YrhL
MDSNLKYRPDIDGLRAVAVLGVVLFHANLGVPGGYVGVDIFFVISGFLITSLILKDLRQGTFSMVGFWERRIRRIFPALAVVVATCLLVGWFLLLPFAYLVLAQSAIALSFFASNIQFWRTANYFGPEAEENLLLHTWSLSVEEQFYIIVPLLLAGLFAWKREKLIPWVLGIGAITSFALSVLWLQRNPSDAFYLLPSRAWELAAGSLLVFLPKPKSYSLQWIAGLVGILLIAFAFVFYSKHDPFPGVAALPPVIGTALVIWSGSEAMSWLHRGLSWKPVVAMGLLSYSLYLWHWPIFALHRYLFGASPSPVLSVVYVVLAVLLSLASLHFVEKPFRERRWAGKKSQIFGFFFAGTAIIAAFSFYVYRSGGVPQRLPMEVAKFDRVEGNEKFPGLFKKSTPTGAAIISLGVSTCGYDVFVWGDSHAEVALGAVHEVCEQLGLGGIAITRGGTPPVFNWSGWPESTIEHQKIVETGEIVRGYFSENAAECPKNVLLVFRWTHYVPRKEQVPQMDKMPLPGFGDALAGTIQFFQKKGANVAVIMEPPVFRFHVPRAVAMNAWRGFPMPRLTLQEHEKFNKDYAGIVEQLRKKVPEAQLLDPLQAMLDQSQEVEFLDGDGVLLYRDEHHLTSRGASRLKPLIKDFLNSSPEKK